MFSPISTKNVFHGKIRVKKNSKTELRHGGLIEGLVFGSRGLKHEVDKERKRLGMREK